MHAQTSNANAVVLSCSATCSLFVRLISHQPAVLFSQNKPTTSNQLAVLFSQNKSAPATSHHPNEQADDGCNYANGTINLLYLGLVHMHSWKRSYYVFILSCSVTLALNIFNLERACKVETPTRVV
jgi:hypothetical protein